MPNTSRFCSSSVAVGQTDAGGVSVVSGINGDKVARRLCPAECGRAAVFCPRVYVVVVADAPFVVGRPCRAGWGDGHA